MVLQEGGALSYAEWWPTASRTTEPDPYREPMLESFPKSLSFFEVRTVLAERPCGAWSVPGSLGRSP